MKNNFSLITRILFALLAGLSALSLQAAPFTISLSLCELIEEGEIPLSYETLANLPEITSQMAAQIVVDEETPPDVRSELFWNVYIKTGIMLTQRYGSQKEIENMAGLRRIVRMTPEEGKLLFKIFLERATSTHQADENRPLDPRHAAEEYIDDFAQAIDCPKLQ